MGKLNNNELNKQIFITGYAISRLLLSVDEKEKEKSAVGFD